MNALEKIMQNADVTKVLKHYGFNISSNNNSIIRSSCKIHGGDNPTAFVMNTDNGFWYCHTGDCGGGDIAELIIKMENFEGSSAFPNAVKWLSDFYDVDISNLEIIERKNQSRKELENFIKIMKKRKKKDVDEYIPKCELKELKSFRNFKKETIEHFGLHFTDLIGLVKRNGDMYTLNNRLVFPIIFNDIQIGVSLRRTKSSDYPKWSHQPVELETGNILYNYDNVKHCKEIVICEGITDVWAFHEIGIPSVCTFGANLTDKQYRLLMKTGADIITAYDGDEAGRNATKKAIEMFKNKANISMICFEEGQDPENIPREELLKLYGERKNI